MNRKVYTQIKRILEKHFLIYPITAQHQFIKDLGFNHLEFNEMINYLEREFQVEINDNEFQKIRTIKDAAFYVQKYQAA